MSEKSKLIHGLLSAGHTLAVALALFAAAIFSLHWIGPENAFFDAVISPGIMVWKFSNWLCPPYGERCFLLSERQIAHHAWGLICYIGSWWLIFSALNRAWRSARLHLKMR